MINIVIFSKDRPCQLELLLRSMRKYLPKLIEYNISVILKSQAPYSSAYNSLKDSYPFILWKEEDVDGGFRDLTISSIYHRNEYTMFLVDDIVFRRTLSTDSPSFRLFQDDPEVVCYNPRMNPHINYCYTEDRTVVRPNSYDLTTHVWGWKNEEGDWGYPSSTDGHIFRTKEIRPLAQRLSYAQPNYLEGQMHAKWDLPGAKMVCEAESLLVNLPMNKVQDANTNRHGTMAAIDLHKAYQSGKRISLQEVEEADIVDPHQDIPIRLL